MPKPHTHGPKEEKYFDYKDFKGLQRNLNAFGQIETRKRTGLSQKEQNRLNKAVKRARHLGLLPFVQG